MSLRDFKALACSPKHSWSSKEINQVSMKDRRMSLSGIGRDFDRQEISDFSFDRDSDVNLMEGDTFLDGDLGLPPSVSGQVDCSTRVSLDNSLSMKHPPSLDNIAIVFDEFADVGVFEKLWDPSMHSTKKVARKNRKCVRKLEKPILLVVGEDIPLNEIVLTNELTLVGIFGGRKINAEGLHRWVADSWLSVKVFILPKGWIAFKI